MAVLGSTIGLRFNEYASIRMEHFRCDLGMIYKDYIQCLVVKIEGKCDKPNIAQKLFFQDDVPELCGACMVLIWIWFLKLKGSGPLFPT